MADRVEIHDDEAATVGVSVGTLDWADKMRPLLVAKGLPEADLWLGNPNVQMTRDDKRKVTAFVIARPQYLPREER